MGRRDFFRMPAFQGIFEGLSNLLSTDRKMLYAPVLTFERSNPGRRDAFAHAEAWDK